MKIYTDASFDDKRQVAGIGIVIEKNGHVGKPISNYYQCTSVNEAELFAIYLGCVLAGGKECVIYTDSQTALSHINLNVNKDKPRTREQYINFNRCRYWAYKIRRFDNISFEKVKAHTGNFKHTEIGNQLADIMAKNGRARFYER